MIEVLCEGYEPKNCLDLLQNDYSQKAQWGKVWQKWRWSLVAALIICLLSTAGSLFEYSTLKNSHKTLDQELKNIYLDSFPESQKVVDPQAQMAQKLEDLQKKAGRRGNFFLLYDKTSQLLANTPGFSLNVMRFKNDHFEFDLEISDLQTLDKLKQQLEGVSGVVVEIMNAESLRNHVKARLKLRAGGAR